MVRSSPAADELLHSCERSAVHLEMRDGYSRSDPLFTAWQAGHRDEPADRDAWWRPWLGLVAEARSRGVIIRRARMVSEPVSEYIGFEYDITFMNVTAGELSAGSPAGTRPKAPRLPGDLRLYPRVYPGDRLHHERPAHPC
jgi:hypothetical protein